MFAFILGREFKLSIAEVAALVPPNSIVSATDSFVLVDGISEEVAKSVFMKCGGSIRLVRVEKTILERSFAEEALEYIAERAEYKASKFSFALASFSGKMSLMEMGLRLKKSLQGKKLSVRSLNQKDENLNAAAFKKERLSETLGEIGMLKVEQTAYITTTLLCQDIDAFAERDLGKGRDMVVGMLPPKLARMMVNLAIGTTTKNVCDPFCGLGTVLIEAADLGVKKVVGSDIEPRMVESTNNALVDFYERTRKDFSFNATTLDARNIARMKSELAGSAIVTEGYLGEILGKHSVTLERINEQKQSLLTIYRDFFEGLSSIGYNEPMVISFPFWDVAGKYVFFEEIHELLKKTGFRSESLLPEGLTFGNTKYGTLLYRRPGQTVGREVTRIMRK